MFHIVGMGPGSLNYATVQALEIVRDAELVIGAGRLLDDIQKRYPEKTYMALSMPYDTMIERIRNGHESLRIAVVVTGDSGFYSLTQYIGRFFGKTEYTVLPGISSLQYLFAAIKEPWQGVPLVSLHGKETDIIGLVSTNRLVGMLTDKHHSPSWIADSIIGAGMEEVVLHIGENLSYDDEKVHSLVVDAVGTVTFSDLLVVIVENPSIS